MKLLVHGATLGERDRRMAYAAAGLAGRGHQVLWLDGDLEGLGRAMTPAPQRIRRVRDLARGVSPRADLVLGGGRAPVRAAVAGWLAGARAMGLSVSGGAPRWGWFGRWCWESLDAFAFVENDESGDEAGASTVVGEGCLRWSDEPLGDRPDPDHPDCDHLERACERWLGHRDGPPAPAVFLDRDGTLVVERGYLADADEIELLPSGS